MLWITVPFLVLIFVVIWVLRGRRKGGPVVPKSICGLRAQSVILMDSGIVADKRILEIAKKSGLRVVSNDQYRDWTVKFPFVRKKGRILRGTYKSGAVKWASKI